MLHPERTIFTDATPVPEKPAYHRLRAGAQFGHSILLLSGRQPDFPIIEKYILETGALSMNNRGNRLVIREASLANTLKLPPHFERRLVHS